jgi:hypothetical protein
MLPVEAQDRVRLGWVALIGRILDAVMGAWHVLEAIAGQPCVIAVGVSAPDCEGLGAHVPATV